MKFLKILIISIISTKSFSTIEMKHLIKTLPHSKHICLIYEKENSYLPVVCGPKPVKCELTSFSIICTIQERKIQKYKIIEILKGIKK